MSSDGRRPLAGLRVLSFGSFIAGNGAGRVLADLGADLVKVESRRRPEVLRNPAYGYVPGEEHREPSGATNTVMYATLARGARGLSLDPTTPAGRDLLLRLVPAVDVVIENFGLHVLDRWGCGLEALMAANPRLVVLSMSGYGRTGPRASYLAYGSNISNFTGLTATWSSSGTQSDLLTSVHGALAVLAACRDVARTGRGVRIDMAQVEVVAAVSAPVLLEPLANGRDAGPPGNDVPWSLLAGVYPCAGVDRWVAVEVEDLEDWAVLCRVVERPDLAAATPEEAAAARPALEEALAAWVAPFTPHTAAHRLQKAGLAAGPVQDQEDVVRDPQLRERGFPQRLRHPDLGVVEHPGSTLRLSATPGRLGRPGPRVGEHTAEVLGDWLGLEHAELDALEAAGAIFRAPADDAPVAAAGTGRP